MHLCESGSFLQRAAEIFFVREQKIKAECHNDRVSFISFFIVELTDGFVGPQVEKPICKQTRKHLFNNVDSGDFLLCKEIINFYDLCPNNNHPSL